MSELLYKNYKKEVEKIKKTTEENSSKLTSFMLPKGESPCRRHSLSTIYESPDRQRNLLGFIVNSEGNPNICTRGVQKGTRKRWRVTYQCDSGHHKGT